MTITIEFNDGSMFTDLDMGRSIHEIVQDAGINKKPAAVWLDGIKYKI